MIVASGARMRRSVVRATATTCRDGTRRYSAVTSAASRIAVPVADVGMAPKTAARSLLEEIGSYALGATIQEGAETNATAESDTVPLEVDGVCCFNFKAAVHNGSAPP